MNDELSVTPPIDPAQTIQDMEERPKKKQMILDGIKRVWNAPTLKVVEQ